MKAALALLTVAAVITDAAGARAEEPRLLTDSMLDQRRPSWSPDGSLIIYQGLVDNQFDLFLIPATGGPSVRLTETPENEERPSFSPGGHRVLFQKDGSEGTAAYVAPLVDGALGAPEKLADNAIMPAWAGDDAIVFAGTATKAQGDLGDIYRLRIGDRPELLFSSPWSDLWPAMDMATERVAFFSRAGTEGQTDDIYILTPGTAAPARLTADSASDFAPTWSPDGAHIAFASNRLGRGKLFVINADGTCVRQVSSGDAHHVEPAWSPDGRELAFSYRDFAAYEIAVIAIDLTAPCAP